MHDEQSGEGQRPDPWTPWPANEDSSGQSASADQPGQPGAGQPSDAQPGSFTPPAGYPQADQPADFGYGHPGYPPPPPPAFGPAGASGPSEPGSFTQPIGYPQQSQYGPPDASGQPGYGAYHPYGPPMGYGYTGPGQGRRRISNVIAYIAVALVAALVGGLAVYVGTTHTSNPPTANAGNNGNGNGSGGNGGGGGNFNNPSSPLNPSQTNPGNNNPSISQATEQRVENAVTPGLVVISSSLQYQDDGAEATGMIISSNGLVLTNNHVINGTTGLTATVATTGKRYTARWLGYDATSDVAVIQLVGASGLHTVPLGNSDNVKKNDGVVAMGNANGTGSIKTVTGKITGLHQTITASDNGVGSETLTNMLETNSEIIPGDSGGPLANVNGQVIGMDTAASTDSIGVGSQQDTGFAIPINRAMSIAQQIIGGKASSDVRIGSVGFLGVVVSGGAKGKDSTLTNPNAQANQEQQNEAGGIGGFQGNGCLTNDQEAGVPNTIAPVNSGTLILGALCGTPAATAGMVPGDVVTDVGGKTVSSPSSLVTILSTLKAGHSVQVTWVTPSGNTVERSMTLAAAPPS
jgi:S1-C subfamily serine protease